MELRSDKGALWENFLVSERLKYLQSEGLRPNRYFWRTQQQAEIDYLEERDGLLSAFEFKWQDKNVRIPAAFAAAYPGSVFNIVHRDNFEAFVGG
jgi:predicted AAA+ superfamily ATPase